MRAPRDPTKDLIMRWDRLGESGQGSIWLLEVRGYYPDGSNGNRHAREICDFVSKLVGSTDPTAILFDFSDLRYRWGDALGGALVCAMFDGREESGRPRVVSVVAQGRTLRAMNSLIELSQSEDFRIELFENRETALLQIEKRLAGEDMVGPG